MKLQSLIFLATSAIPFVSGAITTSDFTFESGADASNYSAKGKPNNTYSIAGSLPSDVLQNVYSMLPEGTVVNSDFIAPERYSSIDIDDQLNGAPYATATVTFLNEGAGYRNSLGYFVFDTNNPPTSKEDINAHVIIFPNTSLSVDYSGSSDGAVHLYSQAAFTSDSGEVIADPTSRITTIYPSRTSTVTLEVNSNWQQIYARWVPMASNETELSQVVTLDQASHSYQISF